MSMKELLQPPDPNGYSPSKLPLNPFDQAEKMYFGTVGSFRKSEFNWRLGFFGLLFLCFVLTGALVFETTKSTVKPVFFVADSAGKVEHLKIDLENIRPPTQRQIEFFLGDFVEKTRSITKDDVENRKKWEKAYKFLQETAANRMDAYTTNDHTFDRWGKEVASIKITAIAPVTNDSYQVRWTEQTFDMDGRLKATYRMTSVFTIVTIPNNKESEVIENPLGIYIKDFNWRREQ